MSKQGLSRLSQKEKWVAFLFILPLLLQFAIFLFGPLMYSLYISMTDWNIFGNKTFIGLDNYIDMIQNDRFWRAMGNTAFYLIGIPIGLAISMVLAVWMNRGIPGITFFRFLIYLPVVSSIVAITILWQWMYNYEFGLINHVLSNFGIDPINWLNNRNWVKPAIIILGVWRGLGVSTIFYLAALQNIPKTLYEAADIDGANFLSKFRHITMPLLTPMTFFLIVTGVINTMQIFVEIQIMTPAGGPGYSSASIVFYIWQEGFQYNALGYASAASWMLGLMIFILTIFNFAIQKRWVHQ
ncbi:carbohydrate ABC transporter permease [Evansella sp. AB-rgal1]|uniref:carbohydrate ABC transporter permease n=1 Tax=Evansella sp. AB-rgal1 TaxID=3242696 RepID=UPI00359DCD9A